MIDENIIENGSEIFWFRSHRSTPMDRCSHYFTPGVVVNSTAQYYILELPDQQQHRVPKSSVKRKEDWERVVVTIPSGGVISVLKDSANVISNALGEYHVLAITAMSFERETLTVFVGKGAKKNAYALKKVIGGPPGGLCY